MTTNMLKVILLIFIIITIKCDDDDDHDDHDHEDDHHDQQTGSNLLTTSQIWGFGFLAGLGISVIGFLAALLIVLCKKIASDYCFEVTIKTLFSLAVGALLGDVMVHILPHAYKTQGTKSQFIALIFIAAIIFFLFLDKIFHALGIAHSHWHSQQCHDDHQGAIQNHDHPNKIHNEEHLHDNCSHKHTHVRTNSNINTAEVIIQSNNVIDQTNPQKTTETDDGKKSCWENLKGKGSIGYMNLIGSLIHNFIDGLALGVAFATGNKQQFIPVLIAIVAHEIPREMGDVAVLMTNKFSNIQTILCNGFVNLISLVGVFIGLAVTSLSEVAKTYIMVFVAGNFMYIAADIWRNLFKNKSLCKNAFEFFGLALGVGCMYLVLLAESDQQSHQH